MNRILLLGFFTLLFCSSAQGLVCKRCDSGNDKGCYLKEASCKIEYGKCYTYTDYLDDELYYLRYGCIPENLWTWYCNVTEKDGKYTHIQNRCNTEKCNGKILPVPCG